MPIYERKWVIAQFCILTPSTTESCYLNTHASGGLFLRTVGVSLPGAIHDLVGLRLLVTRAL